MSGIDNSARTTAEELWRAHAAELLRFATVLVGPNDAGDIVVEAVLRSEHSIAGGDVHAPRAYLFRAVANHARDLRRGRTRRWARDLAAIGPAAVAGPDTFVDVRRAVARLSLAQRAVVYFAYWEDMTERDIAELLQLSPGTVHRHLDLARNHLRKVL